MDFISSVLIYDIKYVAISSIFVFLYIMFDNRDTNKIRLIDILAICVLFFFSAFRYKVGSDYIEYYNRYNYISPLWSQISDRISTERLFYWICHLYYTFNKNPFGVFHICAILLYPPLVIFARKISGRPSRIIGAYVFLEMYAMSNNILRQAISLEILMFAYFTWIYGKKKIAIILAALSVGFHISAIIGIVLLIIANYVKPTFNSLKISLAIGLVSIVVWRYALRIISFIPYLNKYVGYLDQNGEKWTRYGMFGYIIFYSLLCFILINHMDQVSENSIYAARLVPNIIVALPLLFIATRISYVNRIALYGYQFAIFLVPEALKLKTISGKSYRIFMILLIFIWFAFSNVIAMDNTFWQYSFQWDI